MAWILSTDLYAAFILWDPDWLFSPEHLDLISWFIDSGHGVLLLFDGFYYDETYEQLKNITVPRGITPKYEEYWLTCITDNITAPYHPAMRNVENFTQIGGLTLDVDESLAIPLAWGVDYYASLWGEEWWGPIPKGWVAAVFENETSGGELLVIGDANFLEEPFFEYWWPWWWSLFYTNIWNYESVADNKDFAQSMLRKLSTPPGPMLELWTDRPVYTYREYVRICARFRVGGTPIENATVTVEVTFPSGESWIVWSNETGPDGLVCFTFRIPTNATLGTYTVYGTAYKPCVGNASAVTEFSVQILIPEIIIVYEREPENKWIGNMTLAKVKDKLTVHLINVGNGTAYSLNASLTLPDGAIAIIDGELNLTDVDVPPGEKVKLWVTFVALDDGFYPFVSDCEYYDSAFDTVRSLTDTLVMTVVWDFLYPVGIVSFEITTGSSIVYNVTLYNYGDFNVTILLVASAIDSEDYPIGSVIAVYNVTAGSYLNVVLTLEVPSWATAPYDCQIILLTGMPENGGYALEYVTETI